MLRAALLGFGSMGRNHARILANLEGVEFVGVVDPRIDTSQSDSPVPWLRSVEEIIDLSVDYCVVATPTSTHEELATILMSSGIHVLIEKPISHDSISASRMTKCASQNGVIAAIGHIERYNAAIRQLRKRVLDGELGEVFQIVTRRQGPFPMRIVDVGVVMDLATHDIDTTRWITRSEYSTVGAFSSMRSGQEHEDLIAITAQLRDMTVVNHIVNWLSPLKERKTVVTGEKGSFVVDTLTTELTFYSNGIHRISQPHLAHFKGVSQGDIHIFAFDKPEPLLVEHENFRNAIMGLDSEIVPLDDATRTLAVAESVVASASTKESVSL